MAGFFNQFLSQLATGDQIKDYQHAARTFVDGLYRLSPKIGTLYHVFIDINPAVANIDQNSQIETGLMAKSVNLPKFSVQTKTLNAYNRKNIVQERIQYDPISMSFHDDSSDVVRNFWYKYYSYYYRDSDHEESLFHQEHKYKPRQEQSWGYTPTETNGTPAFINAIRIYSLHQKFFSSYILMRPTIISFQHGQHTAGEYETMEHQMTVAYEAVRYETGPVTNGTVQGWNVIHYDNTPSPLTSLGGGTTSILGPGGLVEGIGDTVTNLANGNYIQAALGAARTTRNFRNTNIRNVAGTELAQLGRNILRGQNPLSPVFVPTAGQINAGISKAVSAIPGLGRITNTNNINGQNNLLPNSNQGTTDT